MAYNRINWENGEMSKEGYVLIDGQQYQTVQPEYEGNTPIDADNLNNMDEGIKEAHDASVVNYVTTSGTNLNDYTEQGVYFFNGSYTPINIPAGINGWLQVFTIGKENYSGDMFVKQIWYRAGTPDSNDFETYVRTRSWDGVWGSWSTLSPVINSSHLGTNGYIRLQNGLQIAWVEKQVSVTLQTWGNIYYADVSNMPNWEVPFTAVYQQFATINNKQFWAGSDGASTTAPGSIRVLRATGGTQSISVKAIAIGSWK